MTVAPVPAMEGTPDSLFGDAIHAILGWSPVGDGPICVGLSSAGASSWSAALRCGLKCGWAVGSWLVSDRRRACALGVLPAISAPSW